MRARARRPGEAGSIAAANALQATSVTETNLNRGTPAVHALVRRSKSTGRVPSILGSTPGRVFAPFGHGTGAYNASNLRNGRGTPDKGDPGGMRVPSTDSWASPRWQSISPAVSVPQRRGVSGRSRRRRSTRESRVCSSAIVRPDLTRCPSLSHLASPSKNSTTPVSSEYSAPTTRRPSP